MDLESYRPYLLFLANVTLDPAVRAKVSPSDVVQDTLLKAYQSRADVEQRPSGQVAVWLRQILLRTVANSVRDLHRLRRNVDLERSLDESFARSSLRLERFVCASGRSPSSEAGRRELVERLLAALLSLPDEEREAVILRYWQEQKVDDVARHIGCSAATVSRLVQRGISRLRGKMDPDVDETERG